MSWYCTWYILPFVGSKTKSPDNSVSQSRSGAYSFSHATATGTIAQNRAAVTKTSNHIAQSDWNGKTLLSGDFVLDPTKGNNMGS